MPGPRRPARREQPNTLSWNEAAPAPVVLVRGAEDLLAERAVARIVDAVRAQDPTAEVVTLEAADYGAGMLAVATSPSLFAEAKVVVLAGLEHGSEQALADARAYLDAPAPDVVLVLRHGGGQRGRALLDACRDLPTVGAEPLRSDGDKTAFVTAELRAAGRRAEPRAVRALVDAVGSDLRELASACAQLVADTEGLIGVDVVERYYAGRVEATGFQVADAAVAADAGAAVALLRHAFATGVDPVPLVAALAMKLRVLAKVAATRGRGAVAARELGLAPWQVDRAVTELRHWTPEGLAVAITAVAEADAQVKGESRDRAYAVERAVIRVAQAASR